MDNGFICISWFPFIFRAIHQDFIFPNQIDHIETEAFDALVLPEVDHLEQLLTNIGIAPIEVRLCHVKEVSVIFPVSPKGAQAEPPNLDNQSVGWS